MHVRIGSSRPRIEAGIQRPIGIEPANARAALPAQRGKLATHQNLSVCLRHQGIDEPVRCSRIEARIQRPIGIEPPDGIAADEAPAVRLYRQGTHTSDERGWIIARIH